MSASTRLRLAALGAVVLSCLGMLTPAPAQARISTLCTGYAGCNADGLSASGYKVARSTSYWRMYTGHNCTNYVAYRLVKSGMPNTRPWTGSGNATNWGTAMPSITDQTPTVGAVAWWKAGAPGAGSVGHVAYVEQVVSADEIVVSQDSWGGDFSWARITRTGTGWPSGFIHFNDVPMVNTAPPAVSGTAKVGGTLTADAGTWKPGSVKVSYQWRAGKTKIVGATSPTLALDTSTLGKAVTVKVTAKKVGYPRGTAVSSPTPEVLPGEITSTGKPTLHGAARVDSTLAVTQGSWSPTPDAISYQWYADGDPVAGATDPTLSLTAELVGSSVTAEVTAARDGYDPVSVMTPARTVAEGTLTPTRDPRVLGTPRVGQLLTLRAPHATPNAQLGVQWLRDGEPVAGATSETYRVTKADLGARLSVSTELSRPGYTSLHRTTLAAHVRAVPHLHATVTGRHGRVTVAVRVTAAGIHDVPATVTVRLSGHLVTTVALRHGSATIRVHGVRPGKHRFRVVLHRTDTVERAAISRTVRVH